MTSQAHDITAAVRSVLGKKTKQIRAQGMIPANIFGDIDTPQPVQLSLKEFRKLYAQVGETGLINLQLADEKKAHPVLVDSVDIDPLTGEYIHVSFRQVNLKEKITATIPVELIGELTIKEATTVLLREEIEVEALPTDLPEAFEIDLAQFSSIGDEFKVGQLEFDRDLVKLIDVESDQVLLQVQAVEQMEEVVDEAPEPIETTAMGQSEEPEQVGE